MRTNQFPLRAFVNKHHLTISQIAAGAQIPVSGVHGIVNGFRSPRVDTALRLVAFLRSFDPQVTVEGFWGKAA